MVEPWFNFGFDSTVAYLESFSLMGFTVAYHSFTLRKDCRIAASETFLSKSKTLLFLLCPGLKKINKNLPEKAAVCPRVAAKPLYPNAVLSASPSWASVCGVL